MSAQPRRRIPSKKEFDTLLEDGAFVDYFNTFLNQPVFGQRVIFRFRHKDYVVEPPVHRHRYKVYEYEVRDWLRTQRFPAFIQSDLFVEYNLCCRLRDTRDGFLQHKSGDLQSNKEFWQQTTDFLVGHVMGMQYFHHSLLKTPGNTAFACWMDLERFRRLPMNDPERVKMYHYIKQTYLVSGAPRELSLIAKHQAFKGAVNFSLLHDEINTDGPGFMRQLFVSPTNGTEKFSISSPETFNRLQNVMLTALKSYWLPRYILHVHSITANMNFTRPGSHPLSPKVNDANFFASKTRMRLQALFPDSLDQSLSTSPEDVIVDLAKSESPPEDTGDGVQPSDLFSLWGGQQFHEAKLFSTYEDLVSGYYSADSCRASSLWTPTSAATRESTALSPFPLNSNLLKYYDSSEASALESGTLKGKRAARHTNETRGHGDTGATPCPDQSELSPSVRHLIRGPLYMAKNKFEQKNKRLITSLASDALAGRPFETYLSTTNAFGSLVFLLLFNDLQEYLRADPNATDCIGRSVKRLLGAAILRQYQLEPSARQSLFPSKDQDDLCRCLMYGQEPNALIRAQELCCMALRPAWQAFINHDRHNFVCKVTRRGINKLSPTNNVMDGDLREIPECLDVESTSMWTALELAVISRFPNGLKPEYDIQELATIKKQGLGSLARPTQSPTYNAKLRNMVIPPKLSVRGLRVSRLSHYKRPQIPEVRITDGKELQIQKNGTTIDRPSRPRCFLEILTNSVHYEFFKRYLVLKRSATPLVFWKQVQDLKETKNPRQRVTKVSQIFRRFFSKYAQYGAQLDCTDEIIKQITQMDRVTASMMVCAQGAVMRSLEKKWYEPYMATFPEEDSRSSLSSPTPGEDVPEIVDLELQWTEKRSPVRLHTYNLWLKFLRIICHFIRTMKNKRHVVIFWLYLRLQVKRAMQKKKDGSGEVKIVLQNRLLVVNKLPQDLLFWVEVAKYTTIMDDACKPGTLFTLSKMDEENLRVKANAIISCFLNSDIQPKLQVNVTQEAANNVVSLLGSRGPTRSMFHEAIMSLFPVLFHYFKHCCEEWSLLKPDVKFDDMYDQKLRELRDGSPKTVQQLKSPHPDRECPDYLNLSVAQFKRIVGPRGDDVFRIHFSITHGVRMIVPPEGRHRGPHLEGKRGSIVSAQSSKPSANLKERSPKETGGHSGRTRLGSVGGQSRAFSTRVHPLPEADSEDGSSQELTPV